MKKVTSLLMMLMLFVGIGGAQAAVTDLPVVTKGDAYHFYTIRNAKYTDRFVGYSSDASRMVQTTTKDISNVFYVTASTDAADSPVKFHNLATDNLLAGSSAWNGAGINWYMQAHTLGTGVSIVYTNVFDSSTGNAWNNFQGSGNVVDYWNANDPGSSWIFEEVVLDDIKGWVKTYAVNVSEQIKARYPKYMFGPTDEAISALASSLAEAVETVVEPSTVATLLQECAKLRGALKTAENTILASAGRTDILPEDGSTYVFRNRFRGGLMSANENGEVLGSRTTAYDRASIVWELEKVGDNRYYVRNRSNGKYLQQYPGTSTIFKLGDTPVEYKIFPKDNGLFGVATLGLADGTGKMHMDGGSNVVGWDKGEANDWFFESFKSDIPSFSTDTEQKLYFIQHKRGGKYATFAGNDKQITLSPDLTANAFWYFKPAGQATNVTAGALIYNTATALPAADVRANGNEAVGQATGTFAETGKTWYIKRSPVAAHAEGLVIGGNQNLSGNENWDSQHGAQNYVSKWSNDSDNSTWYIVSAENVYLDIAREVDAYINNEMLTSDKAALKAARLLPHTNAAEYLKAINDMKAALRNYQSAFNFAEGTQFTLRNKLLSTYMMAETTDKLQMSVASDSYKNVWTVKKTDVPNAYYLYNEYLDRYVCSTTKVAQEIAIPLTADATAAGKFEIKGSLSGSSLYINFKSTDDKDSNLAYLHGADRRSDSRGLIVVRWDATAVASQWEMTEFVEAADWAQSLVGQFGSSYDFVGGYPSTPELTTAVSTLLETPNVANYKAAEAAIANTQQITFNPANYYAIYNVRSNNYILNAPTADLEGNIKTDLDRKAVTGATPTQINAMWKFVSSNEADRYFVQNVNSGLYMGYPSGDPSTLDCVAEQVKNEGYASSVAVIPAVYKMGVYSLHIKNKDNTSGSYLNKSNDNVDFGVYHVDANNDDGSSFKLKPVTAVPLTITDVQWASVNLPVAVEVPAKVKAYAVTSVKGDAIWVEEIVGVVPANTPVLLNAPANTYNFVIASETGATVNANKLVGTTVKRTGVTDGQFFGLAKSNGKAVFAPYKVSEGKDYLPANKAVLPTSAMPAQSQQMTALYFYIGDPTGVEGVEVDNEKSNIYYDMNGRRVLYPAKGIFVNGNGQKVIFK